MTLLLALLSRIGLPEWATKLIPIILVLLCLGGIGGYIYHLKGQIADKGTTITNLNETVSKLEVINGNLNSEISIITLKAEDTAKSISSLNEELTTLIKGAQEKEDAIKQYQASTAKRCTLSNEWLHLYKQVTTTPNVPSEDPPSGSTRSF